MFRIPMRMFGKPSSGFSHNPVIVVAYQPVHNVVYSGHKWSDNPLPYTCPNCGFLMGFVLTAAVGLLYSRACAVVT